MTAGHPQQEASPSKTNSICVVGNNDKWISVVIFGGSKTNSIKVFAIAHTRI
jgi:hypothetical protein